MMFGNLIFNAARVLIVLFLWFLSPFFVENCETMVFRVCAVDPVLFDGQINAEKMVDLLLFTK